MLERKTVSEVIAAATLCIPVPVDHGGKLAVGTQAILESFLIVRYADVRETGEVDVDDDKLAVTTDSRLTCHVVTRLRA
ncbi:hypothetical protein [Natronorubrum sp. DTA7]|uniref:hypothetical protein n=1 Tax=Natronorubrum sp. DTA7 TaxID=3447016 RepID=UPI003F82D0F2